MQEARKTTVRNRWWGTTGKMKGRGKRGEGTLSHALSLHCRIFNTSVPPRRLPPSLLAVPVARVSHVSVSSLDVLFCEYCTCCFAFCRRCCCFFLAAAVAAAFSATVASRSAVVVATSVVVATAVSSVAAVVEVGFFAGVAVCQFLLLKVLERSFNMPYCLR